MTTPRPTPRLTDDAVSRLPIQAARAELLEEIMTAVAPDRSTPGTDPETGTGARRRWLAPLAAAAVVAAVAGSTFWWQAGSDDPSGTPQRSGLAAQPSVSSGSSAPASPSSQPTAAPGNYRAVLDAPGWTASHTEATGDYGQVTYQNGDASFDISWYGADSYASYVDDREHIVDPAAPGAPVEVLGRPGQMWAYSADDHTTIREVQSGHWMELRGSGMSKADYLALLGQLRSVDLDQYEAALPSTFVSKDERLTTVLQMVSGITAASGADWPAGKAPALSSPQQDTYQLGASVAGAYACAWLGDWVSATAAGDDAEAAEAVRVMGTSRQWPVLLQMSKQGGYPGVVWKYADEIAAGQSPDGYQAGLGC